METERTKFTRHIPQRTCVGCGKVRAKKELVRLVCVAGDRVEVDTGGRRDGRGAYLCREWACWEVGLKGVRVERVLRTGLTQDNRQELIRCGKELLRRS
ncbi:MAG: YlxR family protein [Chloroflexota bacterium]